MISFEDILLDEELADAKFACRLDKCNGACCTFPGELGAPVLDDEAPQIESSIDIIEKYLPERSLKIINNNGSIEGFPGSYSTVCIDKRDCVFVYYEGRVAKCALERAWLNGEIGIRKPLSCHLFPVRVGTFGGKYLYYEKIKECAPAIEEGEANNILLIDTLRDALTRAFGREWYERLRDYLAQHREINSGGRQ